MLLSKCFTGFVQTSITSWPASSWLVSSVFRALHGYCRWYGFNPVQAWIFSGLIFHYCVNSVHCCEDCFHIHFFIRSSHIWSSHIHSHWSTKTTSYLHRSAHLFLTLVGDPHRKESENGCSCLRKFLLHINCLFILFQCC